MSQKKRPTPLAIAQLRQDLLESALGLNEYVTFRYRNAAGQRASARLPKSMPPERRKQILAYLRTEGAAPRFAAFGWYVRATAHAIANGGAK